MFHYREQGPVGVGLTCYCANFLRDMETRLEKNNLELKQKIRMTRQELENRVEKAEGRKSIIAPMNDICLYIGS